MSLKTGVLSNTKGSKSCSGEGTDEPSETADTENRVISSSELSHFGSSSPIPWPERPLVVGI